MHTRPTLTPAVLSWSEGGHPSSLIYNDIYFNNENGLEESKYVFLKHNQLPERFYSNRDGAFTLAETGFGSGLNFLIILKSFLEAKTQGACVQQLHFISIEKHPFTLADLKRAHQQWPELATQAEQLQSVYSEFFFPGCHRYHLADGQVILDLWLGDIGECLQEMHAPASGMVDAWFLDGFAPKKNPDMWSDNIFQQIARLSKTNATLATFTASGSVRRTLNAYGFQVEKKPGFGRKREMLCASYRGVQATHIGPHTKPVTIIGGGIGTAMLAYALTRRGVPVHILCKDTAVAQGASGNRQGIIYPLINTPEDALSAFSIAAFLYTKRLTKTIARQQPFQHHWCGVAQLAFDARSQRKLEKIKSSGFPLSLVRTLDAQEMTHISGVDCVHGGLFFPSGGWIHPREFTNATLNMALETNLCTIDYQTTVQHIAYKQHQWQLTTTQGLFCAQQLVLANGHDVTQFPQTRDLPLYPVRGQVSHVEATPASEHLKTVLCAQGYITPAWEHTHSVGASYQRHNRDCHITLTEQYSNQRRLQTGLPDTTWVDSLDFEHINARAGVRCASRDHLPFIGPLPEVTQLLQQLTKTTSPSGYHYPNLFILGALGARGLNTAALSAEILAAQICNQPLPIPHSLLLQLQPERMWLRKWQKKLTRGKQSIPVQSDANHPPAHNLQHQK